MGSYAYCPKCEHSLPAPWNLSTGDLLSLLHVEDFTISCLGCGEGNNPYDTDAIIVELAERIDQGRNK